MATPSEGPPTEADESRNRFAAWVHRHPRQAALIGFVTALMIFAIIRGFVSDDELLVDRTDAAKARWELIQTAQEGYFDTNRRYADSLDALDGVGDVLDAPAEVLQLKMTLERDGTEVAMTLSGRTIRLRRTLADGAEVSSSCQILASRAGTC